MQDETAKRACKLHCDDSHILCFCVNYVVEHLEAVWVEIERVLSDS